MHPITRPVAFVLLVSMAASTDAQPVGQRIILTPKPGPMPQINGPRLFGVRPGKPFLYRIPCWGQRPITFSADPLPDGLNLDATQGIISGPAPARPGNYVVTFRAKNSHGSASKPFTIVVGETLALTPPMGWNSWYVYKTAVTEKNIRQAADVMIESGLADAGYMYVSVDDCWMKKRGDEPNRNAAGAMLPNARFPDIKGMVDSIHAKGLRAGVYSSPGPWTCARYVGSLHHELQDARQYAAWGFDLLKYDWCTYGHVVRGDHKNDEQYVSTPYRQMGDILQRLDRDIVFNLCQYGWCHVWTWGRNSGGHSWRSTGDLGVEPGDELPPFYSIGFKNMVLWKHAGPGGWNDPDYILIGNAIYGRGDARLQPVDMTDHEQYSYMSLWSLMAAPLFFSGEMTKLDDFTKNILCNTEVIAVNQDALGKQAVPLRFADKQLVLAKPLEDGSLAVGLFNLGEAPRELSVTWDELGLGGRRRVWDVWRHQELGEFDERYSTTVNRHGVAFLRLYPMTR